MLRLNSIDVRPPTTPSHVMQNTVTTILHRLNLRQGFYATMHLIPDAKVPIIHFRSEYQFFRFFTIFFVANETIEQ